MLYGYLFCDAINFILVDLILIEVEFCLFLFVYLL